MKTMKKCLALLLTLLMVLPCATGLIGSGTAFAAEAKAADTNVALHKPVMASGGSGVSTVTDGSTAGSYWDSTPVLTPNAYVLINLGDYYTLSKATVFAYADGQRYYQFKIEVSEDGITFEQVAEYTGADKSTANGYAVDFTKTDGVAEHAKFVKVTMTKNSSNSSAHLYEVQIFGHKNTDYKPSADTNAKDPQDNDNIAYGKPTRANSNNDFSMVVVDGSTDDAWIGTGYPRYVDVDLLDYYKLSEVQVYMPSGKYQFVLYTSTDGVNFTKQFTSELKSFTKGKAETVSFGGKTVDARVVRVNVIANGPTPGANSTISEIKIHGTKSTNTNLPENKTIREKIDFTTYTEWLKEKKYVSGDKNDYKMSETFTETDTKAALEGLIERILGDTYKSWFDFEFKDQANGYDYFTLTDSGSKVKITANNGVSAAMGLNHYLKYFCKVEVSQQTKQVNMPDKVVKVGTSVHQETKLKVRYAYNYCTLSYTMPFFGYEDWQRELDYLMLSGVNLILDTTATEALWVSYLQKYGYSAYDALDFVCGYSYKAWWLMGNLEGYGGNVSDQWVLDTLEMARVNQRYMTVMGAQPCLQAFVGTLPTNFGLKAADTLMGMDYADPNDYLTGTGGWAGFTRPYVINSTYDGYDRLAEDFYKTQEELYGPITDYYAGDFFHEIETNSLPDPKEYDRTKMATKVLDCLTKYDNGGRWILQAWWSNPLPEVLKGFGDKRNTNVLILDLSSAASPKYTNTTTWGGKEFGGTDWVFSILDNYGGRTGVHGTLQKIATDIYTAKTTCTHMQGIGITPEGTQQNPVVFELYYEAAWSDKEIKVEDWIKDYAERRYGKKSENLEKAWALMVASDGIYTRQTADGTGVNYAINNNPSLKDGANVGSYFSMPYNQKKFQQAVEYLMEDFDELKDNETYVYDVVTFLQQWLSGKTIEYIEGLKAAINNKNPKKFEKFTNLLMQAMTLIDEVSGYQQDFLFGEWIGKVDAWIDDDQTGDYDDYGRDMMLINAKALVTDWASQPLYNYAYRQYNGLMTAYYIPLWEQLCKNVQNALNKPSHSVTDATRELPSSTCFQQAWKVVTDDTTKYLTEAYPADGNGSDARGLKAIFEDVQRFHAFAGSDNIAIQSGTGYAQSDNGGSPPLCLNDGSSTLWIANGTSTPVYAGIKLDAPTSIKTIRIVAEERTNKGTDYMEYKVEVKVNGKYQEVYKGKTYNEKTGNYTTDIILDKAVVTDDVRVTITGRSATTQAWPALAEIELYNSDPHPTSNVNGDMDGDQQVTVKDVTMHMMALAGKGAYVASNVDINGDGALNSKDTSRLLQYLADDSVEIF